MRNVCRFAAASIWFAAAGIVGGGRACAEAATVKPIEVKVVVVTMFEIGADAGDKAGEFQLWKARQKLDPRLPFAHHHDLFFNDKTGVLGMVTGEGTANSATAVMELGMDPRFDLSHAYWVVAGIAGVDPEDASIGSAAWAQYVVDGDLAHEIDGVLGTELLHDVRAVKLSGTRADAERPPDFLGRGAAHDVDKRHALPRRQGLVAR